MAAPASDSLIELRDVRKSYFNGKLETRVLHGLDVNIKHGDYTAIMGQSGSGKSTLMNILGCLDKPTKGEYWLNGKDVSKLTNAQLATVRNETIGFVFQSFNLLKRMTVIDNVALPLIYAGKSRTAARKHAQTKLDIVGLGPLAERRPAQLSGGQQQRVAIARALVCDPPLLLADEPTGNLDTKTSDEIIEVLKHLNQDRGLSIVLVTHEPDVAAHAQRLVRLKDGLVIYDGPTAIGLQQMQAAAVAELAERKNSGAIGVSAPVQLDLAANNNQPSVNAGASAGAV
jgi:putative ABC transport system ATP-binding protein